LKTYNALRRKIIDFSGNSENNFEAGYQNILKTQYIYVCVLKYYMNEEMGENAFYQSTAALSYICTVKCNDY